MRRSSALVAIVVASLVDTFVSGRSAPPSPAPPITQQQPAAVPVVDRWTTQGPDGGNVSVLTTDPSDPNTVYAGAQRGGVFKSGDGGASWSAMSEGLTNRFSVAMDITSLIVGSPTRLYAGTNGGVYTSADGALSWTRISNGLGSLQVRDVSVDPSNPAVLYAATNNGVFKTSNGGGLWQTSNSGISTQLIQALAIDPTNAAMILAATVGAGVFRSTDSGATWTPGAGTAGQFVNVLRRDSTDPAHVFAGASSGLFRSIDGGATWSASNTGLPASRDIRALIADPASASTLYAGLSNGAVYRSIDSGLTWSAVGVLPGTIFLSSFARTGPSGTTLLAATTSGVFGSADGGQTWVQTNVGLSNSSSVGVVAAADGTVYGASVLGVFLAQDNGHAWLRRSSGLSDRVLALAVAPSNSAVVYAAGVTSINFTSTYRLHKSIDGGLTWTQMSSGLPNEEIRAIEVDPSNPDIAYVAAQTVFKTIDGGGTWTAAGSIPNSSILDLAIDPVTPTTLYAATAGTGAVYKSTNGGGTWTPASAGIANQIVRQVAIDPGNATRLLAAAQGGIFRSVDGGVTWAASGAGIPGGLATAVAFDAVSPGTAYAGLTGGLSGTGLGVYRTVDGGQTWAEFNSGLTNLVVRYLAVAPGPGGDVYAGTEGSGIAVRPVDGTPPVVTYSLSPAANANGWNNTDLVVTGIGSDPQSGVVSIACAGGSFTFSGAQQISRAWNTEGVTQITCVATNGAGLTNSITFPVRLDKTPPTIQILSPTQTTYDLHQVVNGSFSCSDPISGFTSCQSTSPNDAPIDTASAGSKTFTVSLSDAAGNFASRSVNYSVRKGTATITVSGGTFPYNGQSHPATGQITGLIGENLGTPAFTYNGSVVAPVQVGTYGVVASFAGNSNYLPAQNSTASIVITRAATVTTLTSTPNPSGGGQMVTLTATIGVTLPGGGVPTGSVQFFDGTTLLGSAAVSASTATFATLGLPPGMRSLTARYSGDSTFLSSQSAILTHEVKPLTASSLTALSSSPSPSALGAAVTLTATVSPVSGSGVPSGTVDFFDGATPLGSAQLTAGNGVGRGTLNVSTLPLGDRQLIARYRGDTVFAASESAPYAHTVYTGTAPAATTTTLASAPNPSFVGQVIDITATVRSNGGSSVPAGTVDFFANGAGIGGGTLVRSGSRASARLSYSALPRGVHTLTAIYRGGSGFASSSSANLYQCVDCLASNAAPRADAGLDQSVKTGALVLLDGTRSSDPEGAALIYNWSIVSKPKKSTAALNNTASARPVFTADVAGSYVVQLVVNDGLQNSAPDTVTITAGAGTNLPPTADAGPDQTVAVNQQVTLDGSGSSDPEVAALSYAWLLVTRPAGSQVVLAAPNTSRPQFFADVIGSYVFELVVNDGLINSAPDRVTVNVQASLNRAPTANAGPDETAVVGATVQLDGSFSVDLDGDPLTFLWSFVSRPTGSSAALSDPLAVRPTFVMDRSGDYVLRLVVNDGAVDSVSDTVTIRTGNSRPVAEAGAPQTVALGATVHLDGSASSDVDGNILTYAWTFVSRPAGSIAAFSDPTSVMPTFVADVPGTYVVGLIVNDGSAASDADTVSITTGNSPPVSNAGLDQSVSLGATVTLDGVGSSDVDQNPLTFAWSFTSRPAGSTATLSDPAASSPTFVADSAGMYVLQLIVHDGTVAGAPDTVVITTLNSTPLAEAGPPQSVAKGAVVQLDGTASRDADADPLTYAWSFTSRPTGSAAMLSDAAIARPTFTADVAGLYVVQLIVRDGHEDSQPDTVTITVTDANSAPTANAGPDQSIQAGDTVLLDGRNSQDANGDALTYVWTLVSAPAGSSAVITGATTAQPRFVADLSGTYVVQLVVNDGQEDSQPDTVTIRTNQPPVARAGADQDIPPGGTVQLDGSASFDPDDTAHQPPCGVSVQCPLTFQWIFNTRPTGSTAILSDAASATPTFVADVPGTYVLQLVVNDSLVNSASDTVTIRTINRAPIADAGPDQTNIVIGATVQLDGWGSRDPDDPNAALTYRWRLASLPATSNAVLQNPGAANPTFVADRGGTYVVELIVNDGVLDSSADTVVIRTLNRPPVASAGPDAAATVGTSVTLNGSNSSDPDADPLTYQWRTVSVPAGSAISISASTVTVTFVPDVHGTYEFELVVSDGSLSSAADRITITANLGGMQLELVGTPLVGVGGTATLRATLDAPAPAGGTQISLTSGSPGVATVATPATVVVPAGARVGNFTLNGVTAGSALMTATAPAFLDRNLTIAVTANVITMTPTLNVPFGQTASLPVTLAPDPAPAGGLTITIESADPTVVGVDTATVAIPAGQFSANATLRGVGLGSTTVVARHPSFASAASMVTSRGELSITDTSVVFTPGFQRSITVEFRSNGIPTAAPSSGVNVTLTAADPTCVSVPSPLAIASGLVSGTATLAYGGTAALPCTTTVTASGQGLAGDSVSVRVDPDPEVTVFGPGFSRALQPIGHDLQAGFFVFVGTTQHGGVTVTVESGDPSIALVSATGASVGLGSIQLTIPNGQNTASFAVQALGSVGSATTIRATASRFTAQAPVDVSIAQTGLRLSGLAATATTVSADQPFTVWVDRLNASGTDIAFSSQVVRGGFSFTATVTSSAPTVGTLKKSSGSAGVQTVTIAGGQNLSPSTIATGGVAFDALAAGSTTVSASINGAQTVPAGTVNVTVSNPAIQLLGVGFSNFAANAIIGAGLQYGPFFVQLDGSNHGGVNVQIASDNSGLVLVSNAPSTAGAATTTVFVPDGQTSGQFYIHAVAQLTGTANLTATAPGFAPSSGVATVVKAAVRLSGVPATTTTLSADIPFSVIVDRPNQGATDLAFTSQVVRAGTSMVVTLTSSMPSVATLQTAGGSSGLQTVTIGAGQNQSPSTEATGGISLDPLSAGTTTITASIPSGEAIPTGTTTTMVSGPGIALLGIGFSNFASTAIIGAGLQHGQFFAQLGGSNHGGVTVRIASGDATRVLLSTVATTVGTSEISEFVPDGQSIVSFYIHAVEGTTGTATVTATAPGFSDASESATVVQAALIVTGVPANTTTLSADAPITVMVDRSNSDGTSLAFSTQVVRAGRTMTATITSSVPTVGAIKTSAGASGGQTVTIAAGQNQSQGSLAAGGAVFDPIAAGTTVVSATIPGVLTTPGGTTNVSISAPAVQLFGPGFAPFGATAEIGAGLQHGAFIANLGGANHGGVNVQLSTSNSARVLLSTTASAPGAATATVFVPDGQTAASFYIHAVAGTTGTVTVTASATGFTDATGVVTVVQTVLRLTNLPSSTTILSGETPFSVWVDRPNSDGTDVAFSSQVVRAGTTMTATINSSVPGVGRIRTSSGVSGSQTVTIAAGQNQSPSGVSIGGAAFVPVAVGPTVVSATIPNVVTTLTGSVNMAVTAPDIQLFGPNFGAISTNDQIGAGLQHGEFMARLGAGGHPGVRVRIESLDPSRVLISANPTSPGAPFIEVDVAAGSIDVSFVVHGMENTLGPATVAVTATGFVSTSHDFTIVTPAIELNGLPESVSATGASVAFSVQVGVTDAQEGRVNQAQSVRIGAPAMIVTVTNSESGVAQLVTAAGGAQSWTVPIVAGTSSTAFGAIEFDPLGTGTTLVRATHATAIPTTAATVNLIVN